MVAIVYYQEANTIAICSILLSMLSVSTKSMIFSRSIDTVTFLFNWLCCICDFYSIFYFISWVFYNPHIDDDDGYFEMTAIGYLWIGKLCIGIAPGMIFFIFCALIFGTGALVIYTKDHIKSKMTTKRNAHRQHISFERRMEWDRRQLARAQDQQPVFKCVLASCDMM